MSRTHEEAARSIARWAPKAGETPAEVARFEAALVRWMKAAPKPDAAAGLARGHDHSDPFGGGTYFWGSSQEPWGADDFDREAVMYGLDFAHAGVCPRPIPRYRETRDRRSDGKQPGVLECGHCHATLPLADKRPLASAREPIMSDAAPQPEARGPTELAQRTIPKIYETWRDLRRRTGHDPSRTKVAQLVGIDRGTLSQWERDDWLTLPPT